MTQKEVVKKSLKRKFTDVQIKMLTSEKPLHHSKTYAPEDIAVSFKLYAISPKAHEFVRKNLVPLCSIEYLQRELKFLHINTGFIASVRIYMKFKFTETVNRPTARLAGCCFDEMSIKNYVEYDKYYDSIRGTSDRKHIRLPAFF